MGRQYFEYYVAFQRTDDNNDGRISFDEFQENYEMIKVWVGDFDAESEFKKIDSNGGGFILFDEFCKWAIKKNLDLEDDDDFEVPDAATMIEINVNKTEDSSEKAVLENKTENIK